MIPSLTEESGTKGHKGGFGVMEQKEVLFSNLHKMVGLLISPVSLENKICHGRPEDATIVGKAGVL